MTNAGSKTYNHAGLKFHYPTDRALTDKSTPGLQLLYLSKPQSTVLIVISTPMQFLETYKQFSILQTDSYSKYGDAILKSFSSKGKKAEWKPNCIDFNGRKIVGAKYDGFYKNEAGTGEIYPFALGNRFLTLAYLRTESEHRSSDIVWRNLIKSLYLKGSSKDVGGVFFDPYSSEQPVMNGRAKKLVKPGYPVTGKEGSVQVRVLIDEAGNVVSAEALTGNPVFYKAATKAAKASKFYLTIGCDKALKVDGIIVYNFTK